MDSRRRVFGGLLRRMLVLRDDVCTRRGAGRRSCTPTTHRGARGWGDTGGATAAALCARCDQVKEAPGWRVAVIYPGRKPARPARGTPPQRGVPRKRRPPGRAPSSPGDAIGRDPRHRPREVEATHPDRARLPQPGAPADRVGLAAHPPPTSTRGIPTRTTLFRLLAQPPDPKVLRVPTWGLDRRGRTRRRPVVPAWGSSAPGSSRPTMGRTPRRRPRGSARSCAWKCPSSTLDSGSTPANDGPVMWLFMLMSKGLGGDECCTRLSA